MICPKDGFSLKKDGKVIGDSDYSGPYIIWNCSKNRCDYTFLAERSLGKR